MLEASELGITEPTAEIAYRVHALTCAGTGCVASASQRVHEALVEEVKRRGLESEVRVVATGCRGFCSVGPVISVYPDGIFYCQVTVDDAPQIVEETFLKGRIVERLLYREPATVQALPYYDDIPFYGRQVRIALRNVGVIDPENIEEYIARDGYQALGRALSEMTPEQVIAEVKRSGLRGRGGAGFLTGLKWEFTRKAAGEVKYVICNADEGDPGAFMDCATLEGDPHTVLEGMLIAGYAIGAREGFIYCRAEYPLAIQRLTLAIKQARSYGLLGKNILGSGFSFDVSLKQGAGAFVCGEETALIASIEGRRGEPRPRPPFPAVSGLWGKPTNINNVETWANVPPIILKGAGWFAGIGTEKSKGTKVFSLTGKINNIGLVEVPMGITLGDIVFDVGGGMQGGKPFKAVQTGGPLGGCLPVSALNTPVDYDSLTAAGATMGSGGMIVVDEDTCMVEFAKFFLTFAVEESCGQCTPCRVGGKRMLELITRISEGRGTMEDLERIEELAATMSSSSLCALGQLTPSPVMSSLRFFREEFIAHIRDKRCLAGQCSDLVVSRCQNTCPLGTNVPSYVGLIAEGKFNEAYGVIRAENPFPATVGRVCIHECETKCRRGAVDDPVAICSLKRFVADYVMSNGGWHETVPGEKKTQKVAVVGGGPVGISVAHYMALQGYRVTVFEALSQPGGMLMFGIPEYRLPKNVLQWEIDAVKKLGVEIRTNVRVGQDLSFLELLSQGYEAVFIGVGAHKSQRLNIAGENLVGVVPGIRLLRDINMHKEVQLGRKVAVIGGGNTAIDVARSAVRLRAQEVHLFYRRTRAEMPALAQEVEEAEREGVHIHELVAPVRMHGANGKLTSIELVRMKLGDFDAGGRRKPVPIAGSEFVEEVDTVVVAIGQSPDLSFLSENSGFEITPEGTFWVDRLTYMTNRPGFFAGGDSISQPNTVIDAIASGRKAAIAMDRYLQGQPLYMPPGVPQRPAPRHVPVEQPAAPEGLTRRAPMPTLSLAERKGTFSEVDLGFTAEIAVAEAKRCLRCDLEPR